MDEKRRQEIQLILARLETYWSQRPQLQLAQIIYAAAGERPEYYLGDSMLGRWLDAANSKPVPPAGSAPSKGGEEVN